MLCGGQGTSRPAIDTCCGAAAVLGEKKHDVVSLDAISIIAGEPGDAMDVST